MSEPRIISRPSNAAYRENFDKAFPPKAKKITRDEIKEMFAKKLRAALKQLPEVR